MSISQNFPEEGPTLNLNFAGSRTLDPRITFTRTQTTSNGSTYMGRDGLIKYAGPNEPRFDHRYVNGEIESLGLLIEEQRSNLINYGNDYSASPGGWVFDGSGSRTKDLVGPDGVANNAWTISDTDNAGDFTRFYKILGVTPSTTTNYCISSFVKNISVTSPEFYVFFAGSSTKGSYINYNFSTDTITSFASDGGGIQPTIYGRILYPNGWVRIYFVVNDANNGSNTTLQYRIYPNGRGANTTGAMGLFGSQIEIGTFPTSYIPTEGSTKTRTHDRAYYENVDQTNWFNKTEGTVVFEHTDVPYNAATPAGYPAIGFGRTSDGGSQPSIQYFIGKNNAGAQYLVRTQSAGDSANINTTPYSTGNTGGKVGFVYKENDYVLSKDGEIEGIDSLGAVPDAYMLIFGMNVITHPTNNMNAHIKNLQYYPNRLTNTQLQTLTK